MRVRPEDTTTHAGWYPDPAGSGLLRLWSDGAWTSRVEPPSSSTEPQYDYAADGTIIRVHQYD